MELSQHIRFIHRILSLAAILFGLVTVITGTRVFVGFEPGYKVFLPLLFYNITMGVTYIAAGVIAWRNPTQGRYVAAAIFFLNFLVLGIIGYLYAVGTSVAVESVGAMTFRTVIWLVLFLGLAWVCRKRVLTEKQHV